MTFWIAKTGRFFSLLSLTSLALLTDCCTKNSEAPICSPLPTGNISASIGGALLFSPISVFVAGNYAYVISVGAAGSGSALEIIDISNPAVPMHKGSLVDGVGGALLNYPQSIYVSGNYAYIASARSNALEIIDVTDPTAPFHKSSLTNGTGGAMLDYPLSVFVSGHFAYVTAMGSTTSNGTFNGTLEIVDVTDPATPAHKGSITNGDQNALLYNPSSVFVVSNLAYVASAGSVALEIIDVADPSAPAHKGSLSNGEGGALLNRPVSVFVAGGLAYVGGMGDSNGSNNGLEIIDVTNPAVPTHKGKINDGSRTGGFLSVFVSGNYVYTVSRGGSALDIFDVVDPTTPILKGSVTDLSNTNNVKIAAPTSVFVSNDHIYVTGSFENALQIFEASNCK